MRIWWPVERVPVTLEIVHPRKLTALEWAVLRVLDEFRVAPPPASEVAYQLGIEDPSFLEDAIKEAVRLRALAPREGATSRELPDLDFTPMGHELYQRGQIEAEPAEHGELLFIDALTDEDMPVPRGAELFTDTPFPSAELELTARETVGLDRARRVVHSLHPELVKGDGEVRSVEPQAASWPRIVWRPVEVQVHLSPGGALEVTGRGLTDAASRYLASCDPVAAGIVPEEAVVEGRAGGWIPEPDGSLAFDAWRTKTARTLPHDGVEAEVLRLLGQARREVLATDGWLASPAVREKLHALTGQGRIVVIIGGTENRCLALSEPPRAGIAMMVAAGGQAPTALVIDGRAGILAGEVSLRVGDLSRRIRLHGLLAGHNAVRYQGELVQAALAGLGEVASAAVHPVDISPVDDLDDEVRRCLEVEKLRLALGRLALLGDRATYETLVSAASATAPGLERIPLLVRIGSFARALAPDLAPEILSQPAVEAWRATLDQLHRCDELEEQAQLFAGLAPDGAEARHLVDAILRAWNGWAGDEEPTGMGAFLGALRAAVDSRWGRGATAGCSTWLEARDRLLAPDGWTLQTLENGVALAEALCDMRDRRVWASAVLRSLPEPADPAELKAWMLETVALRALSPEDARTRVREAWPPVLEAYPRQRLGLLREVAAVLAPAQIAQELCQGEDSIPGLVSAYDALAAAEIAVPQSWWEARFSPLLPSASELLSTAAVVETAEQLAVLARDGRKLGSIARAWAAQAADQIPAVEAVEGLSWWLGELAPLRGLLQDLERRTARQVVRFRGPLADARGKSTSLWLDCLRAWEELGLAGSSLEDLLAESAGGGQGTSPQGSRTKRSKKRRKRRRR